MSEEKTGVQSISRLFSIVETLAANPSGIPLQKLANETGLAKSTAHRLLGSLIELGYAIQDSITGHYRLTLKMFELSSGVVNDMNVVNTAKPHLDRLAREIGETVHLVIRDGADIVYLYKADTGTQRMASRIGMRNHLYCTGVGKAILATLPYDEVEHIWAQSSHPALTEHTITQLSALTEQLRVVHACGYAIDDEENELGVRCVALALPGPGGRADAAFSISSLTPQMNHERIAQLAERALTTRRAILQDMGLRVR